MRFVWYSQRSCLYYTERSVAKEKIMDTLNSSNYVIKKTFTIKNELKNDYWIIECHIVKEEAVFICLD